LIGFFTNRNSSSEWELFPLSLKKKKEKTRGEIKTKAWGSRLIGIGGFHVVIAHLLLYNFYYINSESDPLTHTHTHPKKGAGRGEGRQTGLVCYWHHYCAIVVAAVRLWKSNPKKIHLWADEQAGPHSTAKNPSGSKL